MYLMARKREKIKKFSWDPQLKKIEKNPYKK